MPSPRVRRWALPLVLASSVLLQGCHAHTPIRPTELPKLNGSFGDTQRGAGAVLTTRTVTHVQGEDGRMVELKGEYDVVMTLKDGRKVEFEHPVLSAVEGQKLRIRSGNRPEASVLVDDISHIEIVNFDGVATSVVGGLILGAGALVALLVF